MVGCPEALWEQKSPKDPFKLACEFRERHSNYRADFAQLEHVKPSLTRLILANKRLVFVDARGEISLRQSSFTSDLTQERK